MSTSESTPEYEKLSDEAKARVLGQFKLIHDAGELRHKSDDSGVKAAREVQEDRQHDQADEAQ